MKPKVVLSLPRVHFRSCERGKGMRLEVRLELRLELRLEVRLEVRLEMSAKI